MNGRDVGVEEAEDEEVSVLVAVFSGAVSTEVALTDDSVLEEAVVPDIDDDPTEVVLTDDSVLDETVVPEAEDDDLG